jgi:hypothetical protein
MAATPTGPSLSLLGPLPPDGGECHSSVMTQEPLAGWRQIQLVFGDGVTGLRVIVALYDSAGRPGMVSDLVAVEGGQRQESVGARVDPDGPMQGTHWLVEGDRHTPGPLSPAEQDGLRALAQAVWDRWATQASP